MNDYEKAVQKILDERENMIRTAERIAKSLRKNDWTYLDAEIEGLQRACQRSRQIQKTLPDLFFGRVNTSPK